MLINVVQSEFSTLLNDPQYTETRECERCHRVYSFSYTSSYKLDTVIKTAKLRGIGSEHGDVCSICRGVATQGHYQPRLI